MTTVGHAPIARTRTLAGRGQSGEKDGQSPDAETVEIGDPVPEAQRTIHAGNAGVETDDDDGSAPSGRKQRRQPQRATLDKWSMRDLKCGRLFCWPHCQHLTQTVPARTSSLPIHQRHTDLFQLFRYSFR